MKKNNKIIEVSKMKLKFFKCDSCGENKTGEKYPITNECYVVQKGLNQCGKCFGGKSI